MNRTLAIILLSLTVLGTLPAGCAGTDRIGWNLSNCDDPDNDFICAARRR